MEGREGAMKTKQQETKPKWTGGEWKLIDKTTLGPNGQCSFDYELVAINKLGDEVYVASINTGEWNFKEESAYCAIAKANAYILAASKDMYAACKWVIELLDDGRDNWPAIENKHLLVAEAKSALTKAEGRE